MKAEPSAFGKVVMKLITVEQMEAATQKLLELCRKGNELLQAKQKEILGELV